MIDIHCHVLPIDDGPKDWLTSIGMCREAEKQGITKIVCTSHVITPGYGIDKAKIDENIKILREKLKEANVNVELVQGAENHFEHNITVKGTDYVLIEFPMAEMPIGVEQRIKDLLKKYKVIIAHPCRYKKIREHPELLKKFVEMGCYAQLNADSLLRWTKRRLAKQFLKEGLIHFIATDAHGKKEIKLLKKALEKAKKIMPDAEKLVTVNPQKMLENKPI
ncbi:hypothetical protein KY311_02475 [Candidatus Woesearchaeota archaeon]|nr:hypothetical protein [Candidatus Woesearchaeota archaeon]MBW3017098.1 hypothetical protein [Candidatus Woesearchaeota archaeon]